MEDSQSGHGIPSLQVQQGLADMSSQTEQILRVSQVGVSEQKQISVPRVCRLFLNPRCGSFVDGGITTQQESQRECARASASKSKQV